MLSGESVEEDDNLQLVYILVFCFSAIAFKLIVVFLIYCIRKRRQNRVKPLVEGNAKDMSYFTKKKIILETRQRELL
jgi:hypothetical protein